MFKSLVNQSIAGKVRLLSRSLVAIAVLVGLLGLGTAFLMREVFTDYRAIARESVLAGDALANFA